MFEMTQGKRFPTYPEWRLSFPNWRPSLPKLRVPALRFCQFSNFKKPSWVIVFQLLFAEATLPGLRNVFGFSPPIPRLLFAIVFIYLVYETVADIEDLVQHYLEYNTTLQV